MPAISNKRSAKAQKIVAAALTIFERHGFQATSLEQIAAQAGMGKSTLYDYFENKEALFLAAVQEARNQWIGIIERNISETDDPNERLKRVAECMLGRTPSGRSGDQRLFVEILIQTIMEGGVFYRRGELIKEFRQHIIRLITNILLEGVSQGHLRPEIACHAEKLAINFLAFLDGMKYYGLVAADYIDVQAQIQFFIKHLIPSRLNEKTVPDTISGRSNNDKMAI